MHLHPADRALLLHCLFEFFDLDRLLFQDVVAIHANAGRRNSRVPAGARRIVAIEARNLVVSRVHLVGKCDRLLRRVALMDTDPRKLPCAGANSKDAAHNSPSIGVGVAWES